MRAYSQRITRFDLSYVVKTEYRASLVSPRVLLRQYIPEPLPVKLEASALLAAKEPFRLRLFDFDFLRSFDFDLSLSGLPESFLAPTRSPMQIKIEAYLTELFG